MSKKEVININQLDSLQCSICQSTLSENVMCRVHCTALDFKSFGQMRYYYCLNFGCNSYYHQILVDRENIAEHAEWLHFGKHASIGNYFVIQGSKVNTCLIHTLDDKCNLNTTVRLDFRVGFKNLTIEKLKSYLMLA